MSTTDQATTTDDWDAPAEDMKRVKCIVHTRPHTHEKGLLFNEEADVPAGVAKAMAEKGQVVLI